MSAVGALALVLFIVFLVGIAVGVVVVIASSARRADAATRREGPVVPPQERWPHLPGTNSDDQEPDEPPWRHARGGR
jgi:MFS superfamily sulfate permease-like transporter